MVLMVSDGVRQLSEDLPALEPWQGIEQQQLIEIFHHGDYMAV